ncbi:MAG: UDP-N-acetylglucosamine 2-epimerase [Kiritimatiellia bacterium]
MKKRKICVVLVDRANYGRMKPVMRAIQEHPALELQTICTGTMLLERFGEAVRIVEADGFPVNGKIYVELEGSVPATMAKSVGFALIEFSTEYQRLQPDVVLMIGDRYEALGAAIAAAYMNVCLCHIQGGEVSGSIDESARHAITKFAHYHFPATQRAAEYIVRMGERPDSILGVGCPSSDLAKRVTDDGLAEILNRAGNGCRIAPDALFLLVVFHPITTQFGGECEQTEHLLEALARIGCQTVLLWPNIDAGADHISKMIRVFRDRHQTKWLRTLINVAPEEYQKVLKATACAVGNSSSFVRDAGFYGTPVVLVGDRQQGRERDSHVLPAVVEVDAIEAAIRSQLAHGRYPPSTLYGDGTVSVRIADELSRLTPYTQKRLSYIYE